MDKSLTNTIYSLYIINKAGGLIYQKVDSSHLLHPPLITSLFLPVPLTRLPASPVCQDFITLPRLAGNDYLRLLSTFHSLHAIAARGVHISPLVPSSTPSAPPDPSFPNLSALTRGITAVETKDFRLHCYPTYTGLKFVLSAGVGVAGVERLLWGVYALYCDFVLKNAFYELEMPIRCEQFDVRVLAMMQQAQTQITQQLTQQVR